MSDSVFTKIINRELPATIRYEDDEFIVFDNIAPTAPVHLLVVPKQPFHYLHEVPDNDDKFHARLLQTARKAAKIMHIEKNYKLFMNVGPQVQQVHHIHLHVMGGWSADLSTEELDEESERFNRAAPTKD